MEPLHLPFHLVFVFITVVGTPMVLLPLTEQPDRSLRRRPGDDLLGGSQPGLGIIEKDHLSMRGKGELHKSLTSFKGR